MNEASNIEPLEKSLAERIAAARRFRQKFKYTGDEEYLMNIVEDLCQRESELIGALEAAEKGLARGAYDSYCDEKHFERNFPHEYSAWKIVRIAIAKAKGGVA